MFNIFSTKKIAQDIAKETSSLIGDDLRLLRTQINQLQQQLSHLEERLQIKEIKDKQNY